MASTMSKSRIIKTMFKIEGSGWELEHMMTHPAYHKYEKERVLEIKRMTPMQYLRECAKIHNGNLTREMNNISQKAVEKYAEKALRGAVFPIPVLDYARKGQEGRHRALAAKMLIDAGFIRSKTIPVAVIKQVSPSESARKAYWSKKFGMKVM